MNRSQIILKLRSKKVAVLKGGWSAERAISLKTGRAMELSLKRLKIPFYSIDVNPQISSLLKEKKIQFCLNALHGPFGEDGQIQKIMDELGIGYTGSGALASWAAMNKKMSKDRFKKNRIPTPPGFYVHKSEYLSFPKKVMTQVVRFMRAGPVFIKPVDQGSAIGVTRVEKKRQIPMAVKDCFNVSDGMLVERWIKGREITVGILGERALPVTEILPAHSFYDFHSKYTPGGSRHVTPAPISKTTSRLAQRLSLKAFQVLGCSVYGRVDLMLGSPQKLMVLEVNTIPGMTPTSLLPESAQAAGISFDDLVLKIVGYSLKK